MTYLSQGCSSVAESSVKVRTLHWSVPLLLLVASGAAIVVTAAWATGYDGPTIAIQRFGMSGGRMSPQAAEKVLERFSPWWQALSDDDRFLLRNALGSGRSLEAARALVDRWSDDPVYRANYVPAMVKDHEHRRWFRIPTVTTGELLAAVAAARTVDPDNALYDLIESRALLGASAELDMESGRDFKETREDPDDASSGMADYPIKVTDPERFEGGLAALRRGIGRKRFTTYRAEMFERIRNRLPRPSRLFPLVAFDLEVEFSLPPAMAVDYESSQILFARAVQLARDGHTNEAMELVALARARSQMQAAGSSEFIDVLIAWSTYCDSLFYESKVHEITGQTQRAAEVKKDWEKLAAFGEEHTRPGSKPVVELLSAGIFWHMMRPVARNYRYDPEPVRTAEQFALAWAGTLGFATLLWLVGLVLGAMTLVSLAVRRRENQPMLLSVGWSGLAKVLGLSIVFPAAVCSLYLLATRGDRIYGLHPSGEVGKPLVEFAVVIGGVSVLLWASTYSVLRKRAAAAGLAVPPPIRLRDRKRVLVIGGLIAVIAVGYLVCWWMGMGTTDVLEARYWSMNVGTYTSSLLTLFLLCWALRELIGLSRKRDCRRFNRTARWSMIPVLTVALTLICLLGSVCFSAGERWAVGRATGVASLSDLDNVNRSDMRFIREYLLKLHAGDPVDPATQSKDQ